MKHAMKDHITMYEPEPARFATRRYTSAEKQKLLQYMRSFEFFAVAGLIYDCVKGNCLREENLGYTDGEYSWSSQDIYHIEQYDAAVTAAFFVKAAMS